MSDTANTNKMRVLGGSVKVGDYITTNKPSDVWWKVEAVVTEERGVSQTRVHIFDVVNKGGYRKRLTDDPGTGRRWYRWIG